MPPTIKRSGTATVQLFHNAPLPSFEHEAVEACGLQDKRQNLLPAVVRSDGSCTFECEIGVNIENDHATFTGPCVHGTPQLRFLYISWKRTATDGSPWIQRIKIPLSDLPVAVIADSFATGRPLFTDITGRRPHEAKALVGRLAN